MLNQKTCQKTFYSKASETGFQLDVHQIPQVLDLPLVFDFYKPFNMWGFVITAVYDDPQARHMQLIDCATQANSWQLMLKLMQAFMEANRDGISADGTVTFQPLPGIADFSGYMANKMNQDLYPMNANSFNTLQDLWFNFWFQNAQVPALVLTMQMVNEFIEYITKQTDLSLWLPPGRYTLNATQQVVTESMDLIIEKAITTPFDGGGNYVTQTHAIKSAPFSVANTSRVSFELSNYDTGAVLASIQTNPGKPNSNIIQPDWAGNGYDIYVALGKWFGFAGVGNDGIWDQLGMITGVRPDGDFALPFDPASGYAYSSQVGTDGGTTDGISFYFRAGGQIAPPSLVSVDWGVTLNIPMGTNVYISKVSIYNLTDNPWYPLFIALQNNVGQTGIATVEQKSIE